MSRREPWSGDPREPDDELHDVAQDPAADLTEVPADSDTALPEEGETGETGAPGEWITGWDPEAHPGPLE